MFFKCMIFQSHDRGKEAALHILKIFVQKLGKLENEFCHLSQLSVYTNYLT